MNPDDIPTESATMKALGETVLKEALQKLQDRREIGTCVRGFVRPVIVDRVLLLHGRGHCLWNLRGIQEAVEEPC
jgi:hypothetical protein